MARVSHLAPRHMLHYLGKLAYFKGEMKHTAWDAFEENARSKWASNDFIALAVRVFRSYRVP